MPEWGIGHTTAPNADGLDWNAVYRRGTTANFWAGFILAAYVMDLKELWNHDALFDYMDRYMEIEEALIVSSRLQRQWSKFLERMWDAYRPDYGPVWTMSPTLKVKSSGGSVSITPDKNAYSLGEKVILKAVADPGYEFTGWSGALSGTDNPVTIIMYANRTIDANFKSAR